MAEEAKKKKTTLFCHWGRPRVRTYQYNYEYQESYYRPMVRYISTSTALARSSVKVETRRERLERRRRAASPPGALSFIERWTNEPFYGRGVGFRSRESVERDLFSSSSSVESSSATRVAEQSYLRRQQSASLSSSTDVRSTRAKSLEAAYKYASDDCLMRSTALDSAVSTSRMARAASQEILNTTSLTKKTLVLDDRNVLHGRTLDERHYLDYPKQHLVCPENCPLHNNPEWRRRFLIGNRFLDAAALGGFDVLYDPTVFTTSRRLLAKLAERSESEVDEILIERSSESESSRRRIRASVA